MSSIVSRLMLGRWLTNTTVVEIPRGRPVFDDDGLAIPITKLAKPVNESDTLRRRLLDQGHREKIPYAWDRLRRLSVPDAWYGDCREAMSDKPSSAHHSIT